MNKREVFVCEHCGKEFDSERECREHEESHIETYTYTTNEEIADQLDHFADWARNYRSGNEVLGIHIESFQNLMRETAKRLRDAEDKNE